LSIFPTAASCYTFVDYHFDLRYFFCARLDSATITSSTWFSYFVLDSTIIPSTSSRFSYNQSDILKVVFILIQYFEVEQ